MDEDVAARIVDPPSDEDVAARIVDPPECSDRGWFGARLERKSGGFYWRRERLTTVIAFFTVLCVIGEVLLAIATPHTLRQAKKTLSGLETMTAISAEVVHLHSSFFYEQELFFSYRSRVICESNHLVNAIATLDNDCTLDNAQEVVNRLDGFFSAVDELAQSAKTNQLNCSHDRPFWKQESGWLGVSWGCRHACIAEEWSSVARSTIEDSKSLAFAIDFADNVKNTMDLMITINDAVNTVLAIVGIGNWIETDDVERKAEAKLRWSKITRAASKGLDKAIQCFETFQDLTSSPTAAPTTYAPTPSGSYTYAPTSVNMTDIDTTGCRDKKEFRGLQQATKTYISISDMGEKVLRFLNKSAQFLDEISVPLVITLICLSAVAHVLIAAFLHRAVYTQEIRKTLWRYFLYAERRMMPQRYSQRASRRASLLGATPDRREPTTAGRAADCACDSSFMVRFWIVYVVSNVLLFGAVALVVFLLLLVYIGYNNARCEYFYRQSPTMKSFLRIAKKDSEGSCFTRLSRDAYTVGTWTRYDVDVNCEARDHLHLKKSDKYIVTLAGSLLLIGNWFLCQWLPAAFAFAKTKHMCDRLHKPVQESVKLLVVDAEAAPGAALVEKADEGDASPPRDAPFVKTPS